MIAAHQENRRGNGPVYRVRWIGGGWEVFDRHDRPVSERLNAQVDGVVHAKELAKRDGAAQVIVYRENGSVASEFFYQRQERSSLSRDDAPPSLAASRPARARRSPRPARR